MANKAEHVLYGTLFIVEMYRWGDLDEHHYTAGVFDNEQDAEAFDMREKRDDPEAFIKRKTEYLKEKYGPKK